MTTIAQRIRELHAMGRTPAEIAHIVERTPQYVGAVLHKHRKREAAGRKGLIVKIGRPKKDAAPGGFGERSEGR